MIRLGTKYNTQCEILEGIQIQTALHYRATQLLLTKKRYMLGTNLKQFSHNHENTNAKKHKKAY